MKLTEKQIAKLTPAQKKARNKAIAYKRAYHKNRKSGSSVVLKKRGRPSRCVSSPSVDVISQAETLIAELRNTQSKAVSLQKEISNLFKA